MKLLHTLEEIKYFNDLQILSDELKDLNEQFHNLEILKLANNFQLEVDTELEKYNEYIGKECEAPVSFLSGQKESQSGKIEGNFYFSIYSKSVRGTFRYKSGGLDNRAIAELKEI